MNNLHRELAPISDAAWSQIEEETTRTLKRYLAGRRVVDVPSSGRNCSARSCDRSPALDRSSRGRHHRKPARGQASCRTASAF